MLPELAAGWRYGPLWARAALRPFAEQVLVALRLHPGELVLDLSDDDGTTAAVLRRDGLRVVTSAAELPGSAAARGRVAAVVAVRGGMNQPPPGVRLEAAEGVDAAQTLLCSWLWAPHEQAVRGAFGLPALAPPAPSRAQWPDLVRFDTADHLWAAALARADVGLRVQTMSAAQLEESRRLLSELAREHLTADAGLRIPATMAVR